MITLTPQMKILIARDRVDFRKGIDGFGGLCRNTYNEDPLSGKVYVFINKSGKSIKILMYDGQGFWLFQKRLSKGKLAWWPSSKIMEETSQELAVHQLQLLLWNGDLSTLKKPLLWRPIKN